MVGAKQKVASAAKSKSGGPSSVSAQAAPLDFNVTDDQYTSSEGESDSDEDIPEKDEVEERLEKLLFGDDDGFRAALKSHGGQQHSTDLVMLSDKEDGEGEDEDDQNLDDVADADVGF